MKKYFCLFCLVAGIFSILSGVQAGEVLWRADFSRNGPLNWRPIHINKGDRFEIKNNELIITGVAAPYFGSRYITDLPDTEAGALCFEVNPNSANAGGVYDRSGFSLMVRLNDVVTAFGWGSWFRYREGAPKKQVHMYNNPPFAKWYPCKIEFNKKLGTLKYYLQDMTVPVFMEENVKFPEKMTMILGNYGLCQGTIENRLRNLRLEKADSSTGKSPAIFVMKGFGSDSYNIDKLAAGLSTAPRYDYVVKPIVNVFCVNNFTLDRMPDFSILGPGSLVIMADMPLNCAKLSPMALKQLENAVREGSTLIVMGGMFTLNKGCFAGTPLEKLMPLKIAGPFEMHDFKNMETFPDAPASAFRIVHAGKIRKEGKIFVQHKGVPLIAGWKYGRGRVIVTLPVPAGDIPENRIYCGLTEEFNKKIIQSVKSLN